MGVFLAENSNYALEELGRWNLDSIYRAKTIWNSQLTEVLHIGRQDPDHPDRRQGPGG